VEGEDEDPVDSADNEDMEDDEAKDEAQAKKSEGETMCCDCFDTCSCSISFETAN